ncbi:MAG: glycosyltransferase 87 family protein [Solirubrobacteraceae bacterium]
MVRAVSSASARLRSLPSWRDASPLVLLMAVSVLSLGARGAWLGQPCRTPCRSAADHVLIFDEVYYVNAARVIAGLHPPAGAPYAGAPAGEDPNAEHPQLAKLIIGGSIDLLGDGPLAWRLGSVVAGSLAILGMFVLVRAAEGGRWPALGAATLMAADNLMLVHGRIGTLDVYVLAAMIWGVASYLRGRPILAGVLIGLGACTKLLGLYALLVLVLVEALRPLSARDAAGGSAYGVRRGPERSTSDPAASLARRLKPIIIRLTGCALSAAVVLVAALAALDRIAPPYDAGTHKLLGGGPFAPFHHLAHVLSFAAHQTSARGPRGIASYPWQWLGDYKPIVYLYIDPAHPAEGFHRIHPAVHFLGMVSPPILLLAVPALLLAARALLVPAFARRAALSGRLGTGVADAFGRLKTGVADTPGRMDTAAGETDILGLAWFIGTFVPFVLLSLFLSRTSYLYYMLLVMPGIYVATTGLATRARSWRRLRVLWIGAIVVAVVVMYPFAPLP